MINELEIKIFLIMSANFEWKCQIKLKWPIMMVIDNQTWLLFSSWSSCWACSLEMIWISESSLSSSGISLILKFSPSAPLGKISLSIKIVPKPLCDKEHDSPKSETCYEPESRSSCKYLRA